jgi:hypothetical protein
MLYGKAAMIYSWRVSWGVGVLLGRGLAPAGVLHGHVVTALLGQSLDLRGGVVADLHRVAVGVELVLVHVEAGRRLRVRGRALERHELHEASIGSATNIWATTSRPFVPSW